jgi:hypothetical protein
VPVVVTELHLPLGNWWWLPPDKEGSEGLDISEHIKRSVWSHTNTILTACISSSSSFETFIVEPSCKQSPRHFATSFAVNLYILMDCSRPIIFFIDKARALECSRDWKHMIFQIMSNIPKNNSQIISSTQTHLCFYSRIR